MRVTGSTTQSGLSSFEGRLFSHLSYVCSKPKSLAQALPDLHKMFDEGLVDEVLNFLFTSMVKTHPETLTNQLEKLQAIVPLLNKFSKEQFNSVMNHTSCQSGEKCWEGNDLSRLEGLSENLDECLLELQSSDGNNVERYFSSLSTSFRLLDKLPENRLAAALSEKSLFNPFDRHQWIGAIPLLKKLSKAHLVERLTTKPSSGMSFSRPPLSDPAVFSAAIPLLQTLAGEPEFLTILSSRLSSSRAPSNFNFKPLLYNPEVFDAALPLLEGLPESQIVQLLDHPNELKTFFPLWYAKDFERALPLFNKLSFNNLMKVLFSDIDEEYPRILDPEVFTVLFPVIKSSVNGQDRERNIEVLAEKLFTPKNFIKFYPRLEKTKKIFNLLFPLFIESKLSSAKLLPILTHVFTRLKDDEAISLIDDPKILAEVRPLYEECSEEEALKIVKAISLEKRPMFDLAMPFLKKIKYEKFYKILFRKNIPTVFCPVQEQESHKWPIQAFLDFFHLFDDFSIDHKYAVLHLRFPCFNPLGNEKVFQNLLPTIKEFSPERLTKFLSYIQPHFRGGKFHKFKAMFEEERGPTPLHTPENLKASIPLLKKLSPGQLKSVLSRRDLRANQPLSNHRQFLEHFKSEGFSEEQLSVIQEVIAYS